MAKIWKTKFSQAPQLWQHHFSSKLGLKAVLKILKKTVLNTSVLQIPYFLCWHDSQYPCHSKDDIKHVSALGSAKQLGIPLLTLTSEVQLSLKKHTVFPPSVTSGCKINLHNKSIEPAQSLTPLWNTQGRARFCEDHQEEASCHAWCSDAGRAVLASSVA